MFSVHDETVARQIRQWQDATVEVINGTLVLSLNQKHKLRDKIKKKIEK